MALIQGGFAAAFFVLRQLAIKTIKIGGPVVVALEVADQVRLSRGRPGSGLINPFPVVSGGAGDLPGPAFEVGVGAGSASTGIRMPEVWARDP